jgi:hypothetical protein
MREFLIRLLDTLNGLSHRSSSPMASLERSMTAAHHAHTSARRALAVAMAEETREAERRLALVAKTSDLEQRAIAAMTADIDASGPRSRWPAANSTPSGDACRNWTADAGLPELAMP